VKQEWVNKKFMAATIGMLCAIAAAAAAVAYPRVTSIVKIRDELITGRHEFELFEEATASVDTYHDTEMPVISASLAEYDVKLPAGERLPELIAEVRRACRASAITDISIVTQGPRPLDPAGEQLAEFPDGLLHSLPLELAGTGTYRGLAALLNNLAAGRRLIVVKSFSIREADGHSGLIAFRAEAEGFCLLKTDKDK